MLYIIIHLRHLSRPQRGTRAISVHTPGRIPDTSAHANLNKIEALTLLSLPLAASYKRMEGGNWSGGTCISLGVEKNETPVRLCSPYSPSSRNFELKALDGTSNPYLALTGVLTAGLGGIVELKDLL